MTKPAADRGAGEFNPAGRLRIYGLNAISCPGVGYLRLSLSLIPRKTNICRFGLYLRPLRGSHRQFVVDLSVFCRRGLCPPLGIAGRSRLLQDCPAGATFPGAVPEKRRPLRGAHRQFVVDLSVFCRRGLCPPAGIAGRTLLLSKRHPVARLPHEHIMCESVLLWYYGLRHVHNCVPISFRTAV